MPAERSLSDKDSSQSSSKRLSRSSKLSSALKKTNPESSSSTKNNRPDPRPFVYRPPTTESIPPAPSSVHLRGEVPDSITAKTTQSLQDQFVALRKTVPHLSDKDWRTISYFQESIHVVLNRAYTELYERHQPQGTQAQYATIPARKRSTLTPARSGHAHALPKAPQTPICPLTPDLPIAASLSDAQLWNFARSLDYPQPWGLTRPLNHPPPWNYARSLNHSQPMNPTRPSLAQLAPVRPIASTPKVSLPRHASITKRKECLACASTNVCKCIQNTFGKELGIAVRTRELRQILGAMTTDELIRVAAKKRYAVVPIDALSVQRQFPALIGSSSIRLRSASPGWQRNSAQRREVIGSDTTESLVGGESDASSDQKQRTTTSEAEAEAESEQQQPNGGGGLVRRASAWMGLLFGRGRVLKRKQDLSRESAPDTQEPREGSSVHGREKRVRRD
ncbi:hypothetical protein BG003_003233 [Podila horticola]|nr:hypothetical protein BG003_003233 [Podila horticola]